MSPIPHPAWRGMICIWPSPLALTLGGEETQQDTVWGQWDDDTLGKAAPNFSSETNQSNYLTFGKQLYFATNSCSMEKKQWWHPHSRFHANSFQQPRFAPDHVSFTTRENDAGLSLHVLVLRFGRYFTSNHQQKTHAETWSTSRFFDPQISWGTQILKPWRMESTPNKTCEPWVLLQDTTGTKDGINLDHQFLENNTCIPANLGFSAHCGHSH